LHELLYGWTGFDVRSPVAPIVDDAGGTPVILW
jgi:hypothetical protein